MGTLSSGRGHKKNRKPPKPIPSFIHSTYIFGSCFVFFCAPDIVLGLPGLQECRLQVIVTAYERQKFSQLESVGRT